MPLIKSRIAEAIITKHRLVKHGAIDHQVLQAAAASDKICGVADLGAVAIGDRVDVILTGFKPVEYGGIVTRGDWLTSDVNGKAVTAAPAAGTNVSVVGRADVSGVAGDICDVFINVQQIQG